MDINSEIHNAYEVIKNGGIILYPTDTVWGIGCDSSNEEAVAKIYALKQREESKSMICLMNGCGRVGRNKQFCKCLFGSWCCIVTSAYL